MEEKKTLDLDVAILGGGFAGVYCGKSLRSYCKKHPEARIGLISDENYMVFQPMLPEVASASVSPRHVVNPIRLLCKGLDIYRAEVTSIDTREKRLTLRPGPFSKPIEVRFQHLVLALGAKIDLSRVPGMPEHAFLMQNVGDAMKLRATVLARFEEANLVTDPDLRRSLLTFVVVGGGYSGVETAGQILDLFQVINQYYENVGPEDFHVYLVHSREHLLPTLSRTLGDYAKRKLVDRGLKLVLNQRVKALTAKKVFLDSGEEIETNTCISTVGNAPHPLVSELAKTLDVETEKGRLKTTETLQVPGIEWLWAAGDCAAVPKDGGGTCPPTAQFAMRQGSLLGGNLAASLESRKPKPFKFSGLGELATIGHHSAVAEVLGMKFSGFLAWWMWRTIYLGKLPGFDRKLRVLIDWTLDLFFPRDINLLSPRYTHSLHEAHLEEGDVLFQAGDPAFSFYVVKRGCIHIRDKDDQLIKAAGVGDFFGERALLDDGKWSYNAVAAEPSSLVSLSSDEFKEVLATSRRFRRLLQRSAQQYRSHAEVEALSGRLPEEVCERPARDLMTADPVTVSDSDSLAKTLRRFNEERHSFYPVMDPDSGKLQGVLQREEFYNFVQQSGLKEDATVADIPKAELGTVDPELSVRDCLRVMVRGGTNKLLVVDREGALKGILSIRDILAHSMDAGG